MTRFLHLLVAGLICALPANVFAETADVSQGVLLAEFDWNRVLIFGAIGGIAGLIIGIINKKKNKDE